VRRRRRLIATLILLVPGLLSLGSDVVHRGHRIATFDTYHSATYFGAALESFIIGSFMLAAASRRRGGWSITLAGLFALALTASIGGQHYFFQQYNAYLNADVSEFASNFRDSIVNQLAADLVNYLEILIPVLVLAVILLMLSRRWVRLTRRQSQVTAVLAPALLAGSLFFPTQHRQFQASTPDVLYFNAVGGVIRTSLGFTQQSGQVRPMARHSLAVPTLTRRPSRPRNVMLVLLESVRADAACIDYDPGCQRTEATNKLFPERIGLNHMHALDSSTAITLAVLWSGLQPTESREH